MRCYCCNTDENIKVDRKTSRYYCSTCMAAIIGVSYMEEHDEITPIDQEFDDD